MPFFPFQPQPGNLSPPSETPGDNGAGSGVPEEAGPETPAPRPGADGEVKVLMQDAVIGLSAFAGLLGNGQGRIDWHGVAAERRMAPRRAA